MTESQPSFEQQLADAGREIVKAARRPHEELPAEFFVAVESSNRGHQ